MSLVGSWFFSEDFENRKVASTVGRGPCSVGTNEVNDVGCRVGGQRGQLHAAYPCRGPSGLTTYIPFQAYSVFNEFNLRFT